VLLKLLSKSMKHPCPIRGQSRTQQVDCKDIFPCAVSPDLPFLKDNRS
jgi:hypothetical protein